jgi:hypothetical protein
MGRRYAGVALSEWEHVRAGDIGEVNGRTIRGTGNGFMLVRSSALKEVSIVTVGAYVEVSVAIAASRKGEKSASENADSAMIEATLNIRRRNHAIRVRQRWGEVRRQRRRNAQWLVCRKSTLHQG